MAYPRSPDAPISMRARDGTTVSVRPVRGGHAPSGWVVAWRTPRMSAAAYWHYPNKTEATWAAMSLIDDHGGRAGQSRTRRLFGRSGSRARRRAGAR